MALNELVKQQHYRDNHSNKCVKLLQPTSWYIFLTYNWPLMVAIMKTTVMVCNDNENDNGTFIFEVKTCYGNDSKHIMTPTLVLNCL